MVARRVDSLSVCNDQGVPLADFQATFCARCVQPECTRSQFGLSKFDQRVQTWHERLIAAPPKMDPSDPRYLSFASKPFQAIDLGPVSEVGGGWIDPLESNLKATPPPVVQVPEPPPLVVPVAPLPEQVETTANPPIPPLDAPNLLGLNTPNRSGLMLPGAPQSPPKQAPKDPWAGPAPAPASPSSGGGVVVKRGATVRFGK